MRPSALLVCAAVLAGCTKAKTDPSEQQARPETMATPPAATAEAGTISLSDRAGTWKIRSTDQDGTNPIETEVRATAPERGN